MWVFLIHSLIIFGFAIGFSSFKEKSFDFPVSPETSKKSSILFLTSSFNRSETRSNTFSQAFCQMLENFSSN